MKTIIDLINGATSTGDRVNAIKASKVDISTFEKRLRVYCQLEWIYWTSYKTTGHSIETFEQYMEQYRTSSNDIELDRWLNTGVYNQ